MHMANIDYYTPLILAELRDRSFRRSVNGRRSNMAGIERDDL